MHTHVPDLLVMNLESQRQVGDLLFGAVDGDDLQKKIGRKMHFKSKFRRRMTIDAMGKIGRSDAHIAQFHTDMQ